MIRAIIIEDEKKSAEVLSQLIAVHCKEIELLGRAESVKEGIEKGRFDDGPRMEQLDVNFANRYLEAYDQWKNKQPVSGPWKTAFDTEARRQPLVLQHLLLGMNVHINLDLGIAASETMAGKPLENLHHLQFHESRGA